MEFKSKQFLHWTYHCLGGIYASNDSSAYRKTVHFFISASCIGLVNVVGGFGYLLTCSNGVSSLLDLFSVTFMPTVILFVMGIIPFITYRFHREIEEMFDYFESCAMIAEEDSDETSEHVLVKRIDTIREALKWLQSAVVICVAYVLVGALDILLFCEQENALGNLQHHIFPMPYLTRISSAYVFWTVYTVESVIFVSACIAGLPEVTFVSMVANKFHNIVTVFCQRMQNTTRRTTSVLDACESWDANSSSAVKSVHRMFEKDVIFFVDFHRRLIRVISLIRSYIEIFDTILLATIFNSLLVCIYLLLLTDLDYALKCKQVIAVLMASLYLYPHCELGTTFKTMVYSLPWYYLPPVQRKLVYIFLCQVQRPIEFRAFMVYSVDLVTFPGVLKAAYSYTNLLRRTITTGRSSFTL